MIATCAWCRWLWSLCRCGTPYGATPPLATSIKVTNTGKAQIKIKVSWDGAHLRIAASLCHHPAAVIVLQEMTPCQKESGTVLATLTTGESFLVTTVCAAT